MHVRDIQATVPRVMGIEAGFGEFLGRRKRLNGCSRRGAAAGRRR